MLGIRARDAELVPLVDFLLGIRQRLPDRREDRVVEAAARGSIGNANLYVIEQAGELSRSSARKRRRLPSRSG
jgi:hypothetical protein